MSWLDSVPTCSSAYAFQAALICEDCAGVVSAQLTRRGVEDDGDSGTFPQGPYEDGGGESDSAGICDRGRNCVNAVKVSGHRIGCPLGNPLTTYGAESLLESVVRDMVSRKKYSRMVGRLLRRIWGDYLSPVPARIKSTSADDLPDSLLRLCKKYHAEHAGTGSRGFHSVILADPDHAYLTYETPASVDLCRSEVDDEGEFSAFEVARIPIQATQGKTIEDVVREAADEGAWE